MPRQARQASGTGIYHVMMRGINHQNIFEEQEDYYQFLNTLDLMAQLYESDGTPFGRNYILYAYCLMSNHIHLLIREREDTIGMAIKGLLPHMYTIIIISIQETAICSASVLKVSQ